MYMVDFIWFKLSKSEKQLYICISSKNFREVQGDSFDDKLINLNRCFLFLFWITAGILSTSMISYGVNSRMLIFFVQEQKYILSTRSIKFHIKGLHFSIFILGKRVYKAWVPLWSKCNWWMWTCVYHPHFNIYIKNVDMGLPPLF